MDTKPFSRGGAEPQRKAQRFSRPASTPLGRADTTPSGRYSRAQFTKANAKKSFNRPAEYGLDYARRSTASIYADGGRPE